MRSSPGKIGCSWSFGFAGWQLVFFFFLTGGYCTFLVFFFFKDKVFLFLVGGLGNLLVAFFGWFSKRLVDRWVSYVLVTSPGILVSPTGFKQSPRGFKGMLFGRKQARRALSS